ncbi:MAG: nucleoside phosphorylase [Saprospiraceae bacterium]|nr:nucleoside phosphorylase [Saprospiraceae bacterium]
MARAALSKSELILNPDGSIYHLHLRPEQIAPCIITVGDPDRVAAVSRHFDRVDERIQKREFVTHTGEYQGQRMSVVSTGIGPDNIDIVFNEIDALFNIDLKSREIKTNHTALEFIRIGTSGSLQASLEVDAFLFSSAGIGLDNLLHFYARPTGFEGEELAQKFGAFLKQKNLFQPPVYATPCGEKLLQRLGTGFRSGITLTAPGFYGPQGRHLRLPGPLTDTFLDAVATFGFDGEKITNFEMETAAIYGLAALLGHEALSCNAILANRINGTFSQKPKQTIDLLIQTVLDRLVTKPNNPK